MTEGSHRDRRDRPRRPTGDVARGNPLDAPRDPERRREIPLPRGGDPGQRSIPLGPERAPDAVHRRFVKALVLEMRAQKSGFHRVWELFQPPPRGDASTLPFVEFFETRLVVRLADRVGLVARTDSSSGRLEGVDATLWESERDIAEHPGQPLVAIQHALREVDLDVALRRLARVRAKLHVLLTYGNEGDSSKVLHAASRAIRECGRRQPGEFLLVRGKARARAPIPFKIYLVDSHASTLIAAEEI